jgi:hypothetical protein
MSDWAELTNSVFMKQSSISCLLHVCVPTPCRHAPGRKAPRRYGHRHAPGNHGLHHHHHSPPPRPPSPLPLGLLSLGLLILCSRSTALLPHEGTRGTARPLQNQFNCIFGKSLVPKLSVLNY